MKSVFTRLGLGMYRKYTKEEKDYLKADYNIGMVGYEIPIKLTEEQLADIKQFTTDTFGENREILGMSSTATVYFPVVDKNKYEKYHNGK